MRVRVYVDGFNLYYRALKGTTHKWLNPLELARLVINPTDTIDLLRYFTARVSPRAGDPGAPARQQAYLSALKTVPEVSIHYGRFLAKSKWRPLVSNPANFVEVMDTEEKGSDVNLASYLLHDGHRDEYDAALVISQDSDLLGPLSMVKDDLNKPVGLLWLDGRQPNGHYRRAVSFVRHVSRSRLAGAQFPDPINASAGRVINKPAAW